MWAVNILMEIIVGGPSSHNLLHRFLTMTLGKSFLRVQAKGADIRLYKFHVKAPFLQALNPL